MGITLESVTLGKSYRDCVSGFTGVVTCKCEYLYETDQVLLESTENKKETKWVSITRLEYI